MRGYQLQGLNWMVSLHHNGLNGILADEMVRVLYVHTLHLLNHPSRVLVKHYKLSHSLPTLGTTALSPVFI